MMIDTSMLEDRLLHRHLARNGSAGRWGQQKPPPDFEGPLPGPRPQLPGWARMQPGPIADQRNNPYQR
jgi:hypothetical protein